ncbi:MAG TPA: hypothetical protein VFW98_10880 [Gemmatimonadaceae bacterium]|nr:hypothetical protein [Gemmatimonadaceae bacterium]
MSELTRLPALAAVHIALGILILLWDLAMARRIARRRDTPAPMSALSALGGLLIVPALVILLANDSVLTGRAMTAVAWTWPVATGLIAAQAIYALAAGLVSPVIGVPIAAYDLALAVIAGVGYAAFCGAHLSETLLALRAAESHAIGIGTGMSTLLLPYFLYVPMLAPATRLRRLPGALAGSGMAALAALWTVLLVLSLSPARRAVHSYDRYAAARLQERPDSDFTVGLKVLPTLHGAPVPLAIQSDLALADSLGAGMLSVYIAPAGATGFALDSLADALDAKRSVMRLVATLDWEQGATLSDTASREQYLAARIEDAKRIARHLHPDYLVPVRDPNGAAASVVGMLPPSRWKRFFRGAAEAVRAGDTSVTLMAHVGGFGARDSALYAWALSPDAPVGAAAISLWPGPSGAGTLDTHMRAMDRWLAATPSSKPQWVLEAGAYPRIYGEASQDHALWGALAWATSRSAISGVVLFEASDYGSSVGLRAPGGRLRPAALAMRQAVQALTGSR